MADFPPYMNGYGYISKTLEAIKPVPVPPKFTYNFLETKLGIKSTSARPVIAFLKRIGFLNESSVPTERYKTFRNPTFSAQMIADGIREGYSELYKYHEYAHELSDSELEGIVLQASNAEKGPTVTTVIKSFNALKALADFDSMLDVGKGHPSSESKDLPEKSAMVTNPEKDFHKRTQSKMNLSYTINLNLPETTNTEVFDAIFQSLNRNILKEND